MQIDLTPASTLLIAYSERFEYQPWGHTIRMWIAEGCDLEKDIVPAMKECMAVKKDIGSISYFTKSVYKRRDARKDTEAAKQAIAERNGHLEATADERRAKSIAFRVRTLKQCHPADERWLAEFEAANGPVTK